MEISTARIDITPSSLSLPMGGYGTSTPRFANGTYSPLYARCIVFWDGTNPPRIIVTADVLGIPRSINRLILSLINTTQANFTILGSHTHNGPMLVDSPDPYILSGISDLSVVNAYSQWFAYTIVDLVNAALIGAHRTVTLDYATTTQNFSANREGLSYVETVVPVIVARDTNGIPAAVLYGYGTHPVTAEKQQQWDGDYPAAASAVIEAAIPNCMAFYLPGPMGDQDPVGTRNWNLRNRLGAELGSKVVSTAATVGRPLGAITTAYSEVPLNIDFTNTPENLASVRSCFATRASTTSVPWYQRHAQKTIDAIDTGEVISAVLVPMQVWKFAGTPTLKMVLAGGEIVSGYGVYFRNNNGGTNALWFVGYANEVSAYLPSNALLQPLRTTASYAGGWDTDFPGIAGGSMTIYNQIGHFVSGSNGVENAIISTINSLLA